jgi:basic membrane protein A and related proteins
VSRKRFLPWLGIVMAAISLVVAAAGTAGNTSRSATFKAAIVTDTAGLNDRSFNALANKGRLRAQKDLKIETRVYISKTSADYRPNLDGAAQDGNRAIVANGFLLADDTSAAALRNPNSIYGIVDYPWASLKNTPANTVGLTFKSEQSGYLVGYLAGLMVKKQGGKQVVSAVGGKKIPSVDNWIAGYKAGARKANKKITVLIDYSGDFPPSTAPKCKEIALSHIAQGAQVVFQVAGGCGLGALDAAKEKKKWGIGVDADQSYLGKHILTSGTKKVDVAVFRFMRDVKNGTLKTGRDVVYTLKNGGQGVGKISPKVPKSLIVKMNAIRKLIIAGKIKPPSKL